MFLFQYNLKKIIFILYMGFEATGLGLFIILKAHHPEIKSVPFIRNRFGGRNSLVVVRFGGR